MRYNSVAAIKSDCCDIVGAVFYLFYWKYEVVCISLFSNGVGVEVEVEWPVLRHFWQVLTFKLYACSDPQPIIIQIHNILSYRFTSNYYTDLQQIIRLLRSTIYYMEDKGARKWCWGKEAKQRLHRMNLKYNKET